MPPAPAQVIRGDSVSDRLTAAQVEAINSASLRAWRRGQKADRQIAKLSRQRSQQAPAKPLSRKKARGHTDYEDMLARQLIEASWGGLTISYRRQYAFAPGRKFKADFYFKAHNLIVEVDGAAHRIKRQFKADIERDQVIFFLDIRKLRVSTKNVKDGSALQMIERAIRERVNHF
jgi:very-short-patch-repair endonuclease